MNKDIMRIKESHGARDHGDLGYDDLCIHPGVDLPEGYKVPKFEVFDGAGNPMAHLRRYCEQLVGIRKNEALLMRLFSRSLRSEALECSCFNSQKNGLVGKHWQRVSSTGSHSTLKLSRTDIH